MADVLRDTDSSASTITISQEANSRPNTVDVESIAASTLVEDGVPAAISDQCPFEDPRSLSLSDGRQQLPETVENDKKVGSIAGHDDLWSKSLSSSENGSRRTGISKTSRPDVDVPCTCLPLAHPPRQFYRCFLASIRRRISYIGSRFTSSQQSTLPPFQHNRSCYYHMNLAARQQLMGDFERMKSSSEVGNCFSERNVSSESFYSAAEGLRESEGPSPYHDKSHYKHMDLEARHKSFGQLSKSPSPSSLADEGECPDNTQRDSPIKQPRADIDHGLVLGRFLGLVYEEKAMLPCPSNPYTAALDSALKIQCFQDLNDLLKQRSPDESAAWKQQKLSKACCTGAIQMVKCLLDNHAQVHMFHLKMALSRQDYDIFYILLSSKHVRISEWQRQDLLSDVERLYPLYKLRAISQLLETRSMVQDSRYDDLIRNGRKEPVFIDACRRNKLEFVKYMLERGTDARCRETDNESPLFTGRTALHIAAKYGYLELAKLLIDHGAWVDDVYTSNRTPLHVAALAGDARMTKLLLQSGASVNARDEARYQPIHSACIKGFYEVVKVLLEAGAEIHSWGNDFFQPIHHAAQDGNNPLLINLLEANGADMKARTVLEQYTPLHLACKSNAYLSVRALLDLSLRPDPRSLDTPLTNASGRLASDVVRYYLQHRADLHCGPGETPLQLACQYSTTDVVDCLLQYGACPHCGPGETPLQIACRYSTAPTVKLLLVAGCNPNVATGVGIDCHLQTPLGIATCRRDLESVRYLLEAGADPNGANASGFAPIHLLARGQTTRAHPISLPHKRGTGADPCHSVQIPMSEVLLILQVLQQHKLNYYARDDRGFRALHYLVTTDYSVHAAPFVHSFVKHVAAHVADIDPLTNAGDSPLDYAVKSCKPWLVEILVRAGARRLNDRSLERASLIVHKMAEGDARLVAEMMAILRTVSLGKGWFEGRYMPQQKERYPQENVYEEKGRMLRGVNGEILGWTKMPDPALCP